MKIREHSLVILAMSAAISVSAWACVGEPLSLCDFKPQALCIGVPGCIPDCTDRKCGPDPECGLPCGSCGPYSLCDEETGQCEACDTDVLCAGRECGEDGCGALCGICGDAEICQDGACAPVCVPTCKARMCGDDGCGGDCGDCPDGADCAVDGLCEYPDGHFCAPSGGPGCPGCPVGVEDCVCALESYCCADAWDAHCVELSWERCDTGCEPLSECYGLTYPSEPGPYLVRPECDADRFGRSCGSCAPGEHCHAGASCLPGAVDAEQPCTADGECQSGHCLQWDGDDLCTLSCTNAGHCPEGWACDATLLPEPWQGLCRPQGICFPACEGTTCGADGCGGTCGTCPEGEACTPEGSCVPSTTDPCAITWEAPGCAGCDCEAEVCAIEPACCLEAWSSFCRLLCDDLTAACGDLGPCHPAGDPCDGCQTSNDPNCWNCSCQECVCAVDPHCCLQQWDDLCVMECQLCGTECPQ